MRNWHGGGLTTAAGPDAAQPCYCLPSFRRSIPLTNIPLPAQLGNTVAGSEGKGVRLSIKRWAAEVNERSF
jgi:hypothetical protein